VRIQEVLYQVKPDVVIETGVAHGGSLVFYAGLLAALGKGRVIGVDIEIRAHNRAAIERHVMAPRISLIEGSSTSLETVAAVRAQIAPGERVLVILDSNHSRDHVARELALYAPLVTPGSYIVACDGIMAQVAGAPRTQADWTWNNPITAIDDFLADHPEFIQEEPQFAFNEGAVRERVTYWPKSFLRRVGEPA
jgi:cephalosporin hydroxylase